MIAFGWDWELDGGSRWAETGHLGNWRARTRGYTLCEEYHADTLEIGCWASSGFSVQGCAQFEQKLRACMDAQVRSLSQNFGIGPEYHHSMESANISPSETYSCKEEHYQLPSPSVVSRHERTPQARMNITGEASLDFAEM
jgi:hypothetical protein